LDRDKTSFLNVNGRRVHPKTLHMIVDGEQPSANFSHHARGGDVNTTSSINYDLTIFYHLF